ncbi:MAG: 2-oxoglutarate dehydrogenase E1 component, partial [Rhodobacteraceae bacterium]|nr:2-oxoglutarate dehydrogenase E1 component [Paracoccaceae bacterium]
MARQEANEAFAQTSFLYGGNAAYIDELYAQYQDNPSSVNVEWQSFFAALKDETADIAKNAKGASWKQQSWPEESEGELISALDGDWAADSGAAETTVSTRIREHAKTNGKAVTDDEVHQATRDSIRAIMMVRAYRMRGHLHANLDPLGLAGKKEAHNELHPSAYGFIEADYHRPIFLDYVLGMEFATIPQMLEVLQRTYCSTMGVE